MTFLTVLPLMHTIVRFFAADVVTGVCVTATGVWVGVADGVAVGVAVGDAVGDAVAAGVGAVVTSGPR